MKNLLLICCIVLMQFATNQLTAQNSSLTKLLVQKGLITQREADSINTTSAFNEKINLQNKAFTLGLEFRPRMEYRDGYKQLRNDTTQAAFFGTHRSRLNFSYSQPRFKFHTSIQDVRIWGQDGQTSTTGSLNVFEAYVQTYLTDYLSIRFGTQKVELDNARIFSAANWSQLGRAHDGVSIVYENEKITTELMGYFNQTSERIFETKFSPTTFTNYKLLNIHYLKAKLHKNITLTTINAADGYESKLNSRVMYVRGTSGGRLDFEKNNLLITCSGYYQYGQLQTNQEISAFYVQPEIQLKIKKLTSRLGAEIMSGDDATAKSKTSKSFVPLYGVAWKFMGNMDYFTSFPKDVKNGGLINPYLFLTYEINNKLVVRADGHLFYLQNNVLDKNKAVLNPYLGFENDLSFKYKFNTYTALDFGFSYLIAQKELETIKGGNHNKTPIWSYVMITFKPELFNYKK